MKKVGLAGILLTSLVGGCSQSQSEVLSVVIPGNYTESVELGVKQAANVFVNGVPTCSGFFVSSTTLYTARHCVAPFLVDYQGKNRAFDIKIFLSMGSMRGTVRLSVLGVVEENVNADFIALQVEQNNYVRPVLEILSPPKKVNTEWDLAARVSVMYKWPNSIVGYKPTVNGGKYSISKGIARRIAGGFTYHDATTRQGWSGSLVHQGDHRRPFGLHLGSNGTHNIALNLAERNSARTPIFNLESVGGAIDALRSTGVC